LARVTPGSGHDTRFLLRHLIESLREAGRL